MNYNNILQLLKIEYEHIIVYIYNIQQHIENISLKYLIKLKHKIYILNKINTIIDKLNEIYDKLVIEHINDDQLVNINKLNMLQYENFIGKNNNTDDVFNIIKNDIKQIGKQYGFIDINNALKIILCYDYQIYFDSKTRQIINNYNNIFIPLGYKLQNNIYNEHDIYVKQCTMHDILVHNYALLYVKVYNNTYIIFNGCFKLDPLNIIKKSAVICNKYINNKIETLYKNVVMQPLNTFNMPMAGATDDNKLFFYKKYIKNIQYYLYYIYTDDELIKYVNDAYELYISIINMPFDKLTDLFITYNIYNMYMSIKLLLINKDKTLAGLLYNLIKVKKYNFVMIQDIIYNNLNYNLQIQLKHVLIILKNDFKINKTCTSDFEQQVLITNMPDNVRHAITDKIEELRTIHHTDNYKQILYIKTLLKFPWPKESDYTLYKQYNMNNELAKTFINNATDILNKYIYGHDTCKTTIKQILCKWITNPYCKGDVLGLVGAPGIGKTLLAKVLGQAINIPFVQIQLGGHADGDLLHGHSYTYNAAQPGIIVKKIIEAGTSRCIMYFDELDKVITKHGSNEIYNILIHLTDTNMNDKFHDKFFQEVTFPMQNILFIFSYNDSSVIDKILYDRIREIKFQPYTIEDKINITQNYLLDNIYNNIGFDKNSVIFDKNEIEYLIINYTSEIGVRNLNRKLETIILKLNVDKMYNNGLFICNNKIVITKQIIDLLLNDNIIIRKTHNNSVIGMVNSLFASKNGTGGIVPIQVYTKITGNKFNITITGNQGKLMHESALYAFTTAINIVNKVIIDKFIIDNPHGIHLHTPYAAIRKDGSSASCAIAIAIISKILNKPVKNNIAVTGEIEPTGNITAIGDLLYKLYGAKNANIKIVYIPKENEKDLKMISDTSLLQNINIILVSNIIDILKDVIENFNNNDIK